MSSHLFLHWIFPIIQTIHSLPGLGPALHQDVSLPRSLPRPADSIFLQTYSINDPEVHRHDRQTLWRYLLHCNLLSCNLILYDYFTFHVFISYLPNYIINSLSRACVSYFFIVLSVLILPLAHEKFFLKSSTFKALALITSSLHKRRKSDKGGWGNKVRKEREGGWGKARKTR